MNRIDMFDNVLYVIGNGFDLYHGVRSAYGCFKDWLMIHDRETYETYETVCRYNERWQDFETSMAYVNRDFLLESGKLFLPDYRMDPDDWSEADMYPTHRHTYSNN